jgi:hypothetical protein
MPQWERELEKPLPEGFELPDVLLQVEAAHADFDAAVNALVAAMEEETAADRALLEEVRLQTLELPGGLMEAILAGDRATAAAMKTQAEDLPIKAARASIRIAQAEARSLAAQRPLVDALIGRIAELRALAAAISHQARIQAERTEGRWRKAISKGHDLDRRLAAIPGQIQQYEADMNESVARLVQGMLPPGSGPVRKLPPLFVDERPPERLPVAIPEGSQFYENAGDLVAAASTPEQREQIRAARAERRAAQQFEG